MGRGRGRGKWLVAAMASVAAGALLALGVTGAFAHQSGCHSAHSCPSDHHTYVWYDGSGHGWDCAEPGAPEYAPSRDTATISYGGYTYYCRAAGSTTPTTTTTAPPPTTIQTTTVSPPPPATSTVRCGRE